MVGTDAPKSKNGRKYISRCRSYCFRTVFRKKIQRKFRMNYSHFNCRYKRIFRQIYSPSSGRINNDSIIQNISRPFSRYICHFLQIGLYISFKEERLTQGNLPYLSIFCIPVRRRHLRPHRCPKTFRQFAPPKYARSKEEISAYFRIITFESKREGTKLLCMINY